MTTEEEIKELDEASKAYYYNLIKIISHSKGDIEVLNHEVFLCIIALFETLYKDGALEAMLDMSMMEAQRVKDKLEKTKDGN